MDITSYTVMRTSPNLVLNESCTGSGGKCGGTFIDRNLYALLTKRYGTAFSSLRADRIGPNSRFMTAFESKKQAFDSKSTRKAIRLPLKMPALQDSHHVPGYDSEYNEITLSVADMLACFEPIVVKIIALVSAQVRQVRKAKQPAVKTVILVGGLGCSKHVRDRLFAWCHENGIRMVTPWSGAYVLMSFRSKRRSNSHVLGGRRLLEVPH